MHLESHATPIGESPQQRYASLHRAIERGLASDEVWNELAGVCDALGNRGEALHCLHRIRDDALRTRAERAVLGGEGRGDGRHTGAPAASSAGSRARAHAKQRPQERQPSVVDHLVDACQFLCHGQMPALALSAMLAFPLVIGVGGALAAGTSPVLLAAVAALPGLCVLAVISGMAREILLRSSEGESDAPGLPSAGQLLAGALRFGADLVTVTTLCAAPAALALAADAPAAATLALAAVGGLLAPLMFALRQVRGDWRPCSPTFFAGALRRAGRGYPVVALAVALAFAPAATVAALTYDRPLWIQIACAGPLLVLPLFAAARLLGTWLERHHAGRSAASPTDVAVALPAAVAPGRAPSRPKPGARRPATQRRRALTRSR